MAAMKEDTEDLVTKLEAMDLGEKLEEESIGSDLESEDEEEGASSSDSESDSEEEGAKTMKDYFEYLKAENEQLEEETLCKVCLDKSRSRTFLPCRHFVACEDCTNKIRNCPICRRKIIALVKTYPATAQIPKNVFQSFESVRREKFFAKK